jgi:hypothetical protein
MSRIMSYYDPKYVAVLSFLISLINSAAFPIFGYILSKILFVMMDPTSKTYTYDSNFWCGMFLILTFG